MMRKGSRILVLVAALALGLVYVLPVWRIRLQAPQYPEGLGMVIRINTIVGEKQHDLRNINNLNHYIGMKRIEPESIPEMRIMPVVVAVLIGFGLLVAALGRRKVLYAWATLFLVVALGGLGDFWKWEYDYGHDLDQEHAIIKIPGMSYQPPLIGRRQILNFTAHSWPGSGGWIAIAAGAIAVGLAISERRRMAGTGSPTGGADGGGSGARDTSGAATVTALALGATVMLSGCGAPTPRPIAFGSEACAQCLMGIEDEGHASELLTRTGRAWVFDSIECMAAFLQAMDDPDSVHSMWVTDFANPADLVSVEEAHFLVSPTLASPMGLGLTAFARLEDREGAVNAFGGRPVDWEEVKALVAERWPQGQPPHGGHSSTQAPGARGG